jgi:hypothetical protein
VKANYKGKNLPDKEYRKVPGRNPLFMIQFAKIRMAEEASETDLVVPTYGISFPGDPGSAKRPAKLVEYVVNTKWWEQNFNTADDEPEGDNV